MKMVENVTTSIINLAGIGLGNGWVSPKDSANYAEFLFMVNGFFRLINVRASIHGKLIFSV
jgi:hypothetical protein